MQFTPPEETFRSYLSVYLVEIKQIFLKITFWFSDMSIQEHKTFIEDLLSLCNTEDAKLNNFSCYKSITNFIPLRISALRVLAACHYLEGVRENIFQVLYKTLEKPNAELQETAFECMKKFIAGCSVEKKLVCVFAFDS